MSKRKATKKSEKSTFDTAYSRIIPTGGGRFARVLIPGGSKLVAVDSQEYQDALAKLALAVGVGRVNEWLRNLGWEQLDAVTVED